MYKLLLSWRYLRSRYIALASIVSVTLGVATLIVVNSVMAGFTSEMKKRLHGILSDLEIASPGLDEIYEAREAIARVREVVGADLEDVSAVVRCPAMIHIDFNGRMITQQIMLIGIDEESYAKVSDFGPFLKNERNRSQISFQLREDGYDDVLPRSGWPYRRDRVAYEQELRRFARRANREDQPSAAEQENSAAQSAARKQVELRALPSQPPELTFGSESTVDSVPSSAPTMPDINDPFSIADTDMDVEPFDEAKDQYTGIIVGMALASRRVRNPKSGEVEDVFLCRPGDNLQITVPTVGAPPRPVYEICTVVDLYESKMHEYDSSFAFMPLSELQRIRGMIGPGGEPTVSAIQIRLRPGADLDAIKHRLEGAFPPDFYPYYIQTWKDTQKPLLAAVEMEITILNILLFLIIAVAGFGILATFFMIVVEKTRDIGILKALGAPSQGVMSIFLSYGFSLGVVGSGVGIVLGLVFVRNLNGIARLVERMTGRDVFDPTIYYFSEIPTIINPVTVTWVALGAVMIAVLASVLPALRAARLHPVEALRYE